MPTRKLDVGKRNKTRKLTGNPVRDLSFLSWRNDSAWMETMRGARWHRALHQEKRFWNQLTRPAHIQKMAKTFEQELRDAQSVTKMESFSIGCGSIHIMSTGGNFQWKWAWSNKPHMASDIDYYDSKAYFTTTDEKDKYQSNLTCQSADGRNLWSKKGISGQVAVINGICYYVTVIYPFNTVQVMCCDAETGKNNHMIYEEPTETRFLGFVRESNSCLYIKSISWKDTRTWRLDGKKVTAIQPGSRNQMPLGTHGDEECGMLMKKDTHEWLPYGSYLKSWIMPPHEPNWINLASGHVLTMHQGRQQLFLCGPHKKPKLIHEIRAGDFNPSPWNKWFDQPFQSFMIQRVSETPYVLYVASKSEVMKVWRPAFKPEFMKRFDRLHSTLHHAVSADGTKVPYLMVQSDRFKNPRGLICYVYSAYGSSTAVGWPYMNWGPLLKRGFAIAYCYARGGGDGDYEWMEEGQRARHIRTIEDFEATIRAVRALTGLPASKTIIYGRSAGGMMVGATTARNPDGDLMGATFTEVPFVDTLRTQTNKAIELTPSGWAEYGNPITSPKDFGALLRISPMYNLPVDGAPGVFVLSRTGLRDLQVLPYEPVKWIQRLRGEGAKGPCNKFLDWEADETHTYSSKKFTSARAMDLAVLLAWSENKIKG